MFNQDLHEQLDQLEADLARELRQKRDKLAASFRDRRDTAALYSRGRIADHARHGPPTIRPEHVTEMKGVVHELAELERRIRLRRLRMIPVN